MDNSSMEDYSGPYQASFGWDQLDKKTLARFAREVLLFNQVHDRAVMPILGAHFGMEAMTKVAIDEWMGSSPVYNTRNRRLHRISGDGVDVIMKGLQLDIGAPHMWLEFHFDFRSHDEGYFWLRSCGAYNHVRAITGGNPKFETQICVHMEDPTFDATAMAVNPGARCEAVYRPPHGDSVPEAGPCRWKVGIADRVGTVEPNQFTEIVRSSRAGQFDFSPQNSIDDGLLDYSGPFKRDFRLEDLARSTLVTQLKEFALDIHLLQRACYLSIDHYWGAEVIPGIIEAHWSAMAPVYQARLRRLFKVEGNDMTAILKLLQLDHHLVPEYVSFRTQLKDERTGYCWIRDCAALGDGTLNGVLTYLLRGQVTGLLQAVQAVNPQAQLEPVDPGETSDSLARVAFRIYIDSSAEPATPSSYAPMVGMNGLLEADLSEHIYYYEYYDSLSAKRSP